MTNETLSVALIVKNEEEHLARTLESLASCYDELVVVDTGSTDRTKEIAESFGAKVYDLALDPFRFDEARNFSFSKCTKDWILWIDADDRLENPENVRKVIDAATAEVDAYFAVYNYAFDQRGLCVARHEKERLVRNNGSLTWLGVLHEAMVQTRSVQLRKTDAFAVSHEKDMAGFDRSSQRNYDIVKRTVDEEGEEETDPRNLLSLANACLGLRQYAEAIPYYDAFTRRSGWDSEIFVALHRMAMCYRESGMFEEAVECDLRAVECDPAIRDSYIGIGQTYMEAKKWLKAEHWLKLSFAPGNQKKAVIHNPAEYSFNPWWFLGHVYANLCAEGKGANYAQKAYDCFLECEKVMPGDKDVVERLKTFGKMLDDRTLADAFILVGAALSAESGDVSVRRLLDAAPDSIKSYPSVCKMRASVNKKLVSSGKDISIFCGNCFEEWDETNLGKGIGGSEEAVIHMAKRLGAMGWNVEIYNSVSEEKRFGNVVYRPFWEFNYLDRTDVFVSWRNPGLLEFMDVNAAKRYVWMHDMCEPGEFTEARWSKCDKIMFLSKAHRGAYPHVPEDKVMYTANGIDADMLLADAAGTERKPWKMINTSAPDRGLRELLMLWPKIKASYPDAEFFWYYGWQTFDSYNADNPERMAFKDEIVRLLNQPGVHEGGRISHAEIAKEMASSDLWVYPTEFFETSCITAMKAQTLGCVPVVTNVGALRETVFSGQKAEATDIYSNTAAQDEFVRLIDVARSENRDTMMAEAKSRFSWGAVADGWIKEFYAGKVQQDAGVRDEVGHADNAAEDRSSAVEEGS